MEANRYAWHSTLHVAGDGIGSNPKGLGGISINRFSPSLRETDYKASAASKCINTLKPFRVKASFPTSTLSTINANDTNIPLLKWMEVELSQGICTTETMVVGRDYSSHKLRALSEALRAGMAPVLSYWGGAGAIKPSATQLVASVQAKGTAKTNANPSAENPVKDFDVMSWLDGGVGPCPAENHRQPQLRKNYSTCGAPVLFSNFAVAPLHLPEVPFSSPPPSEKPKYKPKTRSKSALNCVQSPIYAKQIHKPVCPPTKRLDESEIDYEEQTVDDDPKFYAEALSKETKIDRIEDEGNLIPGLPAPLSHESAANNSNSKVKDHLNDSSTFSSEISQSNNTSIAVKLNSPTEKPTNQPAQAIRYRPRYPTTKPTMPSQLEARPAIQPVDTTALPTKKPTVAPSNIFMYEPPQDKNHPTNFGNSDVPSMAPTENRRYRGYGTLNYERQVRATVALFSLGAIFVCILVSVFLPRNCAGGVSSVQRVMDQRRDRKKYGKYTAVLTDAPVDHTDEKISDQTGAQNRAEKNQSLEKGHEFDVDEVRSHN